MFDKRYIGCIIKSKSEHTIPKNNKKYNLVLVDSKKKKKKLYVSKQGEYKFSLREIDALTTEYDSPKDFILHMGINSKFDKLEIVKHNKSYIKYFTTVYGENEFLKKLSHDNPQRREVVQSDEFKSEIGKIGNELKNDENLFDYLMKKGVLSNQNLADKFNDVFAGLKYGCIDNFNDEIKELFSGLKTYNTVRELVVGISEYKNLNSDKYIQEPLFENKPKQKIKA